MTSNPRDYPACKICDRPIWSNDEYMAGSHSGSCRNAADEIERLTAERDDWKERWTKGGVIYSQAVAERDRLAAELDGVRFTTETLYAEKERLRAALERIRDEYHTKAGYANIAADALAGAADETDDDYGAPCSRCGKVTCECS